MRKVIGIAVASMLAMGFTALPSSASDASSYYTVRKISRQANGVYFIYAAQGSRMLKIFTRYDGHAESGSIRLRRGMKFRAKLWPKYKPLENGYMKDWEPVVFFWGIRVRPETQPWSIGDVNYCYDINGIYINEDSVAGRPHQAKRRHDTSARRLCKKTAGKVWGASDAAFRVAKIKKAGRNIVFVYAVRRDSLYKFFSFFYPELVRKSVYKEKLRKGDLFMAEPHPIFTGDGLPDKGTEFSLKQYGVSLASDRIDDLRDAYMSDELFGQYVREKVAPSHR